MTRWSNDDLKRAISPSSTGPTRLPVPVDVPVWLYRPHMYGDRPCDRVRLVRCVSFAWPSHASPLLFELHRTRPTKVRGILQPEHLLLPGLIQLCALNLFFPCLDDPPRRSSLSRLMRACHHCLNQLYVQYAARRFLSAQWHDSLHLASQFCKPVLLSHCLSLLDSSLRALALGEQKPLKCHNSQARQRL